MDSGGIINLLDWIIAPFYIFIVFIVATNIKKKEIKKNPVYRYFIWGLIVKIMGAIALCFIYVYYYDGRGDTIGYFDSGKTMVNFLFYSPVYFFKVIFSPTSLENLSFFPSDIGVPGYWTDIPAFNAVRFMTVAVFFGFKSYLASSIIMGVFSFSGVWKLYIMFCECYPKLSKQFAIVILFIPSVAFWGSGLLKDSLTLAAAGWYSYSFYKMFIKKEKIISSAITLILSIFILVLIKPYIFVGLLPGSLLWLIWNQLLKFKSIFLRTLIAPLIVFLGLFVGYLFWTMTSSNLGEFGSIDSMISKANSSYEDLKSEYYHGNSFDIGKYDPTISGVLSKFPIATFTGLFRPLIWEAKNPVMFISGMENLMFLLFALYYLFRNPISFFKIVFSNPLVLFSLIFGVFFAFSVAVSTSNFGALVRLRIPAIPFFLAGLVLVEYLSREREQNKSVHSPRKAAYTS